MPKPLSPPKLKLLRVAKAALDLDEETYRGILASYGGASSAKALDGRGFDDVMDRFRALGFVSDARRAKGGTYGERFNMATPRQLGMIQSLFEEVADNPTADHLTAWLEHSHKVSSLRFVTATKAGKLIAALKAWKARKIAAEAVGPTTGSVIPFPGPTRP